jgi:predicted RNase H-like HicB family nuclease
LSHPTDDSNASTTPSTRSTSATNARPALPVTDGSSSPITTRRLPTSTLVTERVPFSSTVTDLRQARILLGDKAPVADGPPTNPALPVDLGLMRHSVVYEHGDTSWGAYVPDLPGCVAVGADRAEVETLIVEAIGVYLDDLRYTGQPAPRLAAPPD